MATDDGGRRPNGEQLLRELHGQMSEIHEIVGETRGKVNVLQDDVTDLKTQVQSMANHVVEVSTRQARVEATCTARSQSYDKHTALTRGMLEKFQGQISEHRADLDEKIQETTERLHITNVTGQVREVRLNTIWRTLAIIGGIIAAGGGLALAAVKLLR
jgi:chromosome segregation ATPase